MNIAFQPLDDIEGLLRPESRGEEAVWYAAAQEGRLVYTRCSECSAGHLPLRPMCPRCGSIAVSVVESAGRGAVYSYTVQHRRPAAEVPVPNIVALIDLDEGFRMLSRIEHTEPDAVTVGARVEVRFARCHDTVAPVFVLAGEKEQ